MLFRADDDDHAVEHLRRPARERIGAVELPAHAVRRDRHRGEFDVLGERRDLPPRAAVGIGERMRRARPTTRALSQLGIVGQTANAQLNQLVTQQGFMMATNDFFLLSAFIPAHSRRSCGSPSRGRVRAGDGALTARRAAVAPASAGLTPRPQSAERQIVTRRDRQRRPRHVEPRAPRATDTPFFSQPSAIAHVISGSTIGRHVNWPASSRRQYGSGSSAMPTPHARARP